MRTNHRWQHQRGIKQATMVKHQSDRYYNISSRHMYNLYLLVSKVTF